MAKRCTKSYFGKTLEARNRQLANLIPNRRPVNRRKELKSYIYLYTSYKTCPRCLEDRDMEDFGSNKQSRDGRAYYCKVCDKAMVKKYYQKNVSTGTPEECLGLFAICKKIG